MENQHSCITPTVNQAHMSSWTYINTVPKYFVLIFVAKAKQAMLHACEIWIWNLFLLIFTLLQCSPVRTLMIKSR